MESGTSSNVSSSRYTAVGLTPLRTCELNGGRIDPSGSDALVLLDISLGQTSTQLTFPGATPRPQLTLSSGSRCKNEGDLRASTAIEFVCDPSAAQSSPRLVAILPPGDEADACAFFFEWRTTYACPTSEGSTFGGFMWFLFISTLTLLGAYLVIGTLYNFFALGLGGTDALPRFSLAGMCYHAGEALAGLREWFAREGWRDWTSGGGGGRGGGYTRWDGEGGGVPRWDAPRRGDGGGGGGGPGGFVRTRPPPPLQNLSATATNPASYQTQVMEPSAGAPNVGGGGGGINGGGDALGGRGGELRGAAAGLNPASQQGADDCLAILGLDFHNLGSSFPCPNLGAHTARVELSRGTCTTIRPRRIDSRTRVMGLPKVRLFLLVHVYVAHRERREELQVEQASYLQTGLGVVVVFSSTRC
ncbi:hypothetical protein C8J57DRAFT_1600786 [Mycena rebaudengoi]|nr:hypothetical protein C8J57DRAFT_1600786 [Mycena rebaudengoi]